MTNVVYGLWVIKRGSGQIYDTAAFITNKVGQMCFDENGVFGKIFSAA